MSAFGERADVFSTRQRCLLMTQSRHSPLHKLNYRLRSIDRQPRTPKPGAEKLHNSYKGVPDMPDAHKGTCFCGAVEIEASGSPEAMGYCHCASCRSWSAGPVNAFTLWKPETVTVTKGEEHIGHYQKTELSDRKFCTQCGGHIMTNHSPIGLVDVYAATLPDLKFEPGVHVNYAETVLPMKDGLTKLKDFPSELGGSGEEMSE